MDRIVAANRAELRRYFSMLARASIAGGALAVSACSSFDASLYQRPLCEGGSLVLFDEGALTGPHQYLVAIDRGQDGLEIFVDEIGEACAGATDRAACEGELAMMRASAGGPHVVITTTGSMVLAHSGTAIDALGGPVETAEDAVLRAWARGLDVSCTDPMRGGVREVAGGFEVVGTQFTEICDPIIQVRDVLSVGLDGTVAQISREEIERSSACVGRRPQGLARAEQVRGRDPVGLFFARVAHLEGAAVPAFEILARELDALGAPRELGERARLAAREEARHADVIGAIARRRGVAPAPVRVASRPLRSIAALAEDNASEGCVRETFGALVGTHQALAARAPDVRDAMGSIAEDETGHAALSHAIGAWAEPRLAAHERARVARARARALDVLRAEAALEHDPVVAREAGLPTPAVALAFVARLASDLPG